MAINFQHVAVSGAVGVLDEALERMDAKAGRVGNFKTYRDYARIGLPVLGLAAGYLSPKWAALGDTVATASIPLLVKSVAQVVVPAGTATMVSRVSRPAVSPVSRAQVGTLMPQDEFRTTRVV